MERIAVVGSRKGIQAGLVHEFMRTLFREQPETIVYSGGAAGVDTEAESEWLRLGGRVHSFRVERKRDQESYFIKEWILGVEVPHIVVHDVPTFADAKSALFFRSTMVVDTVDRVVSFTNPRFSPGTRFTKAYAKDRGVPVYEMVKS